MENDLFYRIQFKYVNKNYLNALLNTVSTYLYEDPNVLISDLLVYEDKLNKVGVSFILDLCILTDDSDLKETKAFYTDWFIGCIESFYNRIGRSPNYTITPFSRTH